MDVFTDNAILADYRVFHYRAFLDNGVRHNDTVAHYRARLYGNAGEQYREVYKTLYVAALAYHGILYLALRAGIVRRHYGVS